MTSKNKIIYILSFIILTFIASISIVYFIAKKQIKDSYHVLRDNEEYFKPDSIKSDSTSNPKAYQSEIKKIDSLALKFIDSVQSSNPNKNIKFKGKKICIMITGVDSRLGSNCKHADANHLVTVWLDEGKVEITSIPRGTYADAGFEPNDTLDFNYLANVRANQGREKYFKEVCNIAQVDKINYYIEFGFSQAIGLLELIGFKDNSVQMLRMLRSRQAFKTGDFQRSYNQGQFIRQMILKLFPQTKGITLDILIRGGLYLVETNLTYDICNEIINKLKEKGFPHNNNDVILKVMPKLTDKFLYFDFTNKKSEDSLYSQVSQTAIRLKLNEKSNSSIDLSKNVSQILSDKIKSAIPDTLKNPQKAIQKLLSFYEQKAWYQVTDSIQRAILRRQICAILIASYNKTKQSQKSIQINKYLDAEDKKFNLK